MKYSTAFSGKKDLNSPYNWAARVLLWLKIRVGRLTSLMTFAMVKVFPDPVTPRRVWALSSFCNPSTNSRMALG